MFTDNKRGIIGESGETYKFQSVGRVFADILHDVTVRHPLRYSSEHVAPKTILNTDEFEDIGMGQRIPKDNFLTELLHCSISAILLQEISLLAFLIFLKSSVSATLNVLTATIHPLY